jgi:hypothetical protein
MNREFVQVTLRADAFLAVAKHLRGEQLSDQEKELCQIAHDAFEASCRPFPKAVGQ